MSYLTGAMLYSLEIKINYCLNFLKYKYYNPSDAVENTISAQ
jgi:hypothetical protein